MVITRMLVVSHDDGCGFLEELDGDTLNSQLYFQCHKVWTKS